MKIVNSIFSSKRVGRILDWVVRELNKLNSSRDALNLGSNNRERSKLHIFKMAVIAGLFVEVMLFLSNDKSPVRDLDDYISDYVVALSSYGERPERLRKDGTLLTLIDIDQDTYRSWGYPAQTPRRQLAKLINYAIEGGAKVIVVDIALWYAPLDRGAGNELIRVISNHLANGRNGTKLIFIEPGKFSDPFRRNWLRDELSDGLLNNNNIVFAHAYIKASSDDFVVRRFDPWRPLHKCPNYPAVSVAVALAIGSPVSIGLTQNNCNNRTAGLNSSEEAQRILYSVGWPNMSAEGLVRISARRVLSVQEKSYGAVNNRLVFIGSTYPESRDIMPTPIGDLPGVVVLMNQTISLLGYGFIGHLSQASKLLISFALIVIFAALAAFLHNHAISRIIILFLIFTLLGSL